MVFYYVEDNYDFEYKVTWEEIRDALCEIVNVDNGEDLHEFCIRNDFEDVEDLAEWYRDDLKDYFYEDAIEWFRENK